MREQIQAGIRRLEKFAHKPWYIPLVAGLATLDMFIFVVPTDTLLVATVALRPRLWVRIAFWFTLASSLGALALAALAHEWGPVLTTKALSWGVSENFWRELEVFIDSWGGLALLFQAFGPFPLQPAVLVAAAANISLPTLLLAVWIGRGMKYLGFAWLATFAPHLLKRWFGLEVGRCTAEDKKLDTSALP